jgi:nitric oxide reductase subunit B
VNGALWKWSFAALNLGLIAMVGALLVSGFAQAFVERAIGGSTHAAFIAGQENRWFVEGMVTRFIFGLIFTAGYVALVYDFLTLGRRAHVVAAVAAAE